MGNIKIIRGVFDTELELEHASVVARSNEAKALGIKAGMPYFQMAQQFPDQKIAVFSSNHELYGELTGRIVSLISKEVPAYFRSFPDSAASSDTAPTPPPDGRM